MALAANDAMVSIRESLARGLRQSIVPREE